MRQIAERAGQLFGEREVVSLTADGRRASNYAEVLERARRLASALTELGVRPGDRVATFGWNSLRHLELYLAVPSMGAVLHTLNIRLFEDDLHYIVCHAEDRVDLPRRLAGRADAAFRGDRARDPHARLRRRARRCAASTRSWSRPAIPDFAFPDLDENTAAAMCYTSGTTGLPKGVVYSHRSTVLHSLLANQADAIGLRERDVVMPVVPMFHANAWGLPYAAAMAGASSCCPGRAWTPPPWARSSPTSR